MEPPRSLQQRKQDTLGRLTSDADAWIASAVPEGDAYLLPLSFLWDGADVIVSTPRSSVTGRNLRRGRRVRVGIGQVRDVIVIDGIAEPVQDEPTKPRLPPRAAGTRAKGPMTTRITASSPTRVRPWRRSATCLAAL
jgi:hypothetical protein